MTSLKPTGLILLCIFAVTIGDLEGQIRDDEQSTNYLAVQCAMSSGGDASNFEEYGRKLAKTVALLSPGQQKRVFGFVPQPITFARPEDSGQSNSGYEAMASTAPDSGDSSGGEAGSIIGNGQTPEEVEPPTAASMQSGPEPLIGNTSEPAEKDSTESDGSDSGNESDWWGSVMKWFGGLVDAIIDDLAKQQQSN